jgi:hypothetical protein
MQNGSAYNLSIESVPKEIYQEILLLLSPVDLLSICSSNVYAEETCDDYLFYKYVITHFSPQDYELESWDDSVFAEFSDVNVKYKTWKDILKLLAYSQMFKLLSYPKIEDEYIRVNIFSTCDDIRDQIVDIASEKVDLSIMNYYIKGTLKDPTKPKYQKRMNWVLKGYFDLDYVELFVYPSKQSFIPIERVTIPQYKINNYSVFEPLYKIKFRKNNLFNGINGIRLDRP